MSGFFARAFYRSKAWKDCRADYVEGREAIDGGICEICRTRYGEEVHHVIKLNPENIADANVTLNPKNFQFLCRHCHFRQHDRKLKKAYYIPPVQGGIYFEEGKLKMQKVYIVYGAPASGKSSYVKERMQFGDFVVDLNELFKAVTGYQYSVPQNSVGNLLTLRKYLYSLIEGRAINAKTVWVIATLPKRAEREELARRFHGELILIDADYDTCVKRAMADDVRTDKDLQIKIIRRWFDDYEV